MLIFLFNIFHFTFVCSTEILTPPPPWRKGLHTGSSSAIKCSQSKDAQWPNRCSLHQSQKSGGGFYTARTSRLAPPLEIGQRPTGHFRRNQLPVRYNSARNLISWSGILHLIRPIEPHSYSKAARFLSLLAKLFSTGSWSQNHSFSRHWKTVFSDKFHCKCVGCSTLFRQMYSLRTAFFQHFLIAYSVKSSVCTRSFLRICAIKIVSVWCIHSVSSFVYQAALSPRGSCQGGMGS